MKKIIKWLKNLFKTEWIESSRALAFYMNQGEVRKDDFMKILYIIEKDRTKTSITKLQMIKLSLLKYRRDKVEEYKFVN